MATYVDAQPSSARFGEYASNPQEAFTAAIFDANICRVQLLRWAWPLTRRPTCWLL